MLATDVAPGIHRVEDAHVNWYVAEADGALLLIDAGLPASRRSLARALRQLGRRVDQIAALVLTHAHFDHVGFAEFARTRLGVEVWVHDDDVPLARKPRQYTREGSTLRCLATHPDGARIVAEMGLRGAFLAPGVRVVRRFGSEPEPLPLPLPGAPVPVFTPGHTLGHVALHFPDRDAVIAGDALVTLDPYTGATGPRIVARAATADSERALRSLDALAATGATVLLPGHGEPWRDGAAAAVAQARAAGVA
ncbi:MBL fold metallo-hydrolase [Conexibacter arvalis]|uniref:Glyoxylase-like metal-dependent hydrolase (Beta-lactamase superfamily II) n=1 Tax=Conexibacter arvalis TaxID=912552 RepID=A0A840IHP2_9ACTN|nr:MBL fold metallo-hydrolase [Conexibacter arvalis]MBB4664296.1 glyoxylase-like metal-dependent hydrolase (beta-lactamase superfamily II) [Conexibacter arvalis]